MQKRTVSKNRKSWALAGVRMFWALGLVALLGLTACFGPDGYFPEIKLEIDANVSGNLETLDASQAVLWVLNATKTVSVDKLEIDRLDHPDPSVGYPMPPFVGNFANGYPTHGQSFATLHDRLDIIRDKKQPPYYEIKIHYINSDGTEQGDKEIRIQMPRSESYRVWLYRDANGDIQLDEEKPQKPMHPEDVETPPMPIVERYPLIFKNMTKSADVTELRFINTPVSFAVTGQGPMARNLRSFYLPKGEWQYQAVWQHTADAALNGTTPSRYFLIDPQTFQSGEMGTLYAYFYKTRLGDYAITDKWPPVPNDMDENENTSGDPNKLVFLVKNNAPNSKILSVQIKRGVNAKALTNWIPDGSFVGYQSQKRLELLNNGTDFPEFENGREYQVNIFVSDDRAGGHGEVILTRYYNLFWGDTIFLEVNRDEVIEAPSIPKPSSTLTIRNQAPSTVITQVQVLSPDESYGRTLQISSVPSNNNLFNGENKTFTINSGVDLPYIVDGPYKVRVVYSIRRYILADGTEQVYDRSTAADAFDPYTLADERDGLIYEFTHNDLSNEIHLWRTSGVNTNTVSLTGDKVSPMPSFVATTAISGMPTRVKKGETILVWRGAQDEDTGASDNFGPITISPSNATSLHNWTSTPHGIRVIPLTALGGGAGSGTGTAFTSVGETRTINSINASELGGTTYNWTLEAEKIATISGVPGRHMDAIKITPPSGTYPSDKNPKLTIDIQVNNGQALGTAKWFRYTIEAYDDNPPPPVEDPVQDLSWSSINGYVTNDRDELKGDNAMGPGGNEYSSGWIKKGLKCAIACTYSPAATGLKVAKYRRLRIESGPAKIMSFYYTEDFGTDFYHPDRSELDPSNPFNCIPPVFGIQMGKAVTGILTTPEAVAGQYVMFSIEAPIGLNDDGTPSTTKYKEQIRLEIRN
jgi:hypothetical protein